MLFVSSPAAAEEPFPQVVERGTGRLITLDFNNVDLPLLVKFFSELMGKNFVIDEKVRGKVTIFSPKKISVDHAFEVFEAVLELKGFSIVKAGEFYQILPTAEVPPERSVFVYNLENGNVDDVAKILLGLVTRTATGPRRPRAGEIASAVQILADKPTNSLIITATTDDFEIIKGVIRRLDAKRRQVFVEAVILEVSVDKFKEFGTDLGAAFGYQNPGRDLTVVGAFNATAADFADAGKFLNPNTPGTIGLSTFNIRAILRALQSSTDVNILSTPQILTSDNQKAEIVVAQNVPFPGSQTQTAGGFLQTTVERKDVGIILRITPQVLENDLMKLDIYQEISSVVDTPQQVGGVVLGPTTNKRSANTTVVARNDQTIVIGGLIRDNVVRSQRKIPLLGDIPLLGWLFKTQSRRVEKTNLLIFLTPHLIFGEEEMEALKKRRSEEMERFLEENRVEDRERRREFLHSIVNPPKAESRSDLKEAPAPAASPVADLSGALP